MVLSLLLAGVIWNLGTWYLGFPVCSSHTLIGSILGVGIGEQPCGTNGGGGVNWGKAGEVRLACSSRRSSASRRGDALLLHESDLREIRGSTCRPRRRRPAAGLDSRRPHRHLRRRQLRARLQRRTEGHGAAPALVLIGFLPFHYAMDLASPTKAARAAGGVEARSIPDMDPGRTPN